MTSAAIILGVVPQLGIVTDVKRSMAVEMIGGIFASVVFTFLLIPVVFWFLERLERQFLKNFKDNNFTFS